MTLNLLSFFGILSFAEQELCQLNRLSEKVTTLIAGQAKDHWSKGLDLFACQPKKKKEALFTLILFYV